MAKRFLLWFFVALLAPVSALAQEDLVIDRIYLGTASCVLRVGAGAPEGAIVGKVCDSYRDSSTGLIYYKTTGIGTTSGWVKALFASASGALRFDATIAEPIDAVITSPNAKYAYWLNAAGTAYSGYAGYDASDRLRLSGAGGVLVDSALTAASFSGSGAGLTVLPAAQLTGTIAAGVQDAITRLGTVTSGVWNAGAVTSSGNITAAGNVSGVQGTFSGALAVSGVSTLSDITLNGNLTGSLMPSSSDTYDIGRYDRLYEDAFISTINAIVFKESTQTIFGGFSTIAKQAGSLAAAVAVAAATIDFGQTMTPGNWVEIRAHDTGGVVKVEYLTVGTLVSGTTYNVTRDLAGSHGTDPAWASGTPFLVRGTNGDGRIDMLAYDGKPRIAFVQQGATYNAQNDRCVLGNLNGYYSYASDTYGLACGSSTAANVTVDPTNGFRIRQGATTYAELSSSVFRVGQSGGNRLEWDGTNLTLASSTVQIGAAGIQLTPGTSAYGAAANGYQFTTSAGFMGMKASQGTTATSLVRLAADQSADHTEVNIRASSTSGTRVSEIQMYSVDGGPFVNQQRITLDTGDIQMNAPVGVVVSSAVGFKVNDTDTITATANVARRNAANTHTGLNTFPGAANATVFTGASGGNLAVFTSTGTGATSWIHYLTTSSAYSFYNGGDRLVIGNTGSIRMPGYGAGTATFDASGNITSSSDERMKVVVGDFAPGLREILGLETKLFRYKESTGLDTRNVYGGFIAQNVLRYVPEAVGEDRAGMFSVNFVPIVAASVNAIQELTSEIDELRAQLKLPPKNRTVAPVNDKSRVISSANARTYPEKK